MATATERHILEERLNKYDQVWVQLALLAVRNTGLKIKGTKAWSPIFAQNRAICRYLNQRLWNFHVTGNLDNKKLHVLTKYVPPKITCEEDIHAHHATALTEWHLAKGNAANFSIQHLEDLIQFHSERRDIKRETAVKQILHWEEVRNLHGRQSRMMTSSKPNVIQTLLVPRPHSTNPTALAEITNPDHIQQVILQRNATKLAAAYGSHFTVSPLSSLVGTIEKEARQMIFDIMDHRVRIHQGVSKTCISHTSNTPLYGSGHGSGAGVVNWHGLNETLITMYEETQPGCLMTSPDNRHEQNQQVISFVDDNKLSQSFLA